MAEQNLVASLDLDAYPSASQNQGGETGAAPGIIFGPLGPHTVRDASRARDDHQSADVQHHGLFDGGSGNQDLGVRQGQGSMVGSSVSEGGPSRIKAGPGDDQIKAGPGDDQIVDLSSSALGIDPATRT